MGHILKRGAASLLSAGLLAGMCAFPAPVRAEEPTDYMYWTAVTFAQAISAEKAKSKPDTEKISELEEEFSRYINDHYKEWTADTFAQAISAEKAKEKPDTKKVSELTAASKQYLDNYNKYLDNYLDANYKGWRAASFTQAIRAEKAKDDPDAGKILNLTAARDAYFHRNYSDWLVFDFSIAINAAEKTLSETETKLDAAKTALDAAEKALKGANEYNVSKIRGNISEIKGNISKFEESISEDEKEVLELIEALDRHFKKMDAEMPDLTDETLTKVLNDNGFGSGNPNAPFSLEKLKETYDIEKHKMWIHYQVASWCCELLGDLDGAITWLERERELLEEISNEYADRLEKLYFVTGSGGANKEGPKENIVMIDSRISYLKTAQTPQVYALTSQSGKEFHPDAKVPVSGTWFGKTVLTGTPLGESAQLVYIEFPNHEFNMAFWEEHYTALGTTYIENAFNGGETIVEKQTYPKEFKDYDYTMDYWIGYYMNPKSDTTHGGRSSQALRDAVEHGGVIEIAWNFASESTAGAKAVLDNEKYIAASLETLGKLYKDEQNKPTIILRLGAEMNNWNDCDPDIYKQAFQKVAGMARNYSNIKMNFSPLVIGKWGESVDDIFEKFYPGDEYVDWIGVSDYQNSNYDYYNPNITPQNHDKEQLYDPRQASYRYEYNPNETQNSRTYGADAFYGTGVYDSDPLVSLQPYVRLAKEHGKPVLISECGFGYYDAWYPTDPSADQTQYAVDQMNKFYSYVNMIYPEVKAVFFFNRDMTKTRGEGGKGERYPYNMAGSESLAKIYQQVIQKNGGYLTAGQESTKTWKPLNEVLPTDNVLELATYAVLPGSESTKVVYHVGYSNGRGSIVWVPAVDQEVDEVPYRYKFNLDQTLTNDTIKDYILKVEAVAGNFRVSQEYTLPRDSRTYAYESSQNVKIVGKSNSEDISFNMYGMKMYAVKDEEGNDTNYIRVRDLAVALDGTEASFNVKWNAEEGQVELFSKQPYTDKNGTEGNAPFEGGDYRSYEMVDNPTILVTTGEDGSQTREAVKLDAILLKDDDENGYTYYQLRDLGKKLGFNVGWSEERGVYVETDKPYQYPGE